MRAAIVAGRGGSPSSCVRLLAETFLIKLLNAASIAEAARLAATAVAPIDDMRSSAEYRRAYDSVTLTAWALHQIAAGAARRRLAHKSRSCCGATRMASGR